MGILCFREKHLIVPIVSMSYFVFILRAFLPYFIINELKLLDIVSSYKYYMIYFCLFKTNSFDWLK